jgi:hypothetical protein
MSTLRRRSMPEAEIDRRMREPRRSSASSRSSRAGRTAPVGLGERIALRVPEDALHLFDATTGRRLN